MDFKRLDRSVFPTQRYGIYPTNRLYDLVILREFIDE